MLISAARVSCGVTVRWAHIVAAAAAAAACSSSFAANSSVDIAAAAVYVTVCLLSL
jgi:hypothetical protein